MALTQAEINEVMQQLQPIIAKELNESTSIAQAQANIQQGVTQYIGARYVPIFAEPIEWDSKRAYEALTIVLYQGNSFTTRQYTPAGIDINNEAFWAETGNYNAQIEQYRKELQAVKVETAKNANKIAENTNKIGENSDSITELRNQLSGSTNSGLLNKIKQLAEQPIEFTVVELSGTQTVLLAKIAKQSVDVGLAYTNGVDGRATRTVTQWAQKQTGTMLAINCDRGNPDVGAYNNIVDGVVDAAGESTSDTNAYYLAFNSINDLTVLPRKDNTIEAIKAMGYNNAFVCGYALMNDGVKNAIPDAYANGCEPTMAIGWNDTHVYVLTSSGRSVLQTGITPNDVYDTFNSVKCKNAVLLDGGGSVQAVYRHDDSCARITPYPAAERNRPLALFFRPQNTDAINAASYAAVQRFNAAYSANRNTFIRSHGKITANSKLPALSTGFARESDVFAGVTQDGTIIANAADQQIFAETKGWHSCKINIPKRLGTVFWALVLINAHITLVSTNSGTYKIGFERIVGNKNYYFTFAEGTYNANERTSVTLSGSTSMNMISDIDTTGHVEVVFRTSTECTVSSINVSEQWQYGEI